MEFKNNQCVKIENESQFNEAYHLLRSAQRGIPLEQWVKSYGYPKFPVYLEHANSVYYDSIGFSSTPKNTWTNEDYEILEWK
jgi:hypothetical protein